MIHTAAPRAQHLTYFDQPTIQHQVCSDKKRLIIKAIKMNISIKWLIKQAFFPALDSFRTIQCWK